MPDRRQLLAVVGAGLAGIAFWRIIGASDEDAIIAVLRKRLDYLRLDETGLREFARDLAASNIISSRKLRLLSAVAPVYTYLVPTREHTLTRDLKHGEERVVSTYLLSSDLFANGADETRVVRYRGFYEPLRRLVPCSNPFSRPLVG